MGIWRLKGMRGNTGQGMYVGRTKDGVTYWGVKEQKLKGRIVGNEAHEYRLENQNQNSF